MTKDHSFSSGDCEHVKVHVIRDVPGEKNSVVMEL